MTATLARARFFLLLVLMPSAALAQTSPVADRDWQSWLNEVRPLFGALETTAARNLPAADRDAFRERFWQRRTDNLTAGGIEIRAQIEARIRDADKRYRVNDKPYRINSNGPWNDCGRTYVLLGKPDWVRSQSPASHFSGSDRLANFREESDQLAETWVYRAHPRLPASPEGIVFRFTQTCEAVGSPQLQRLLEQAAASYLPAAAR
jgi:GWxTD domain-containing protein